MWPFNPVKEPQSEPPRETSAEEDWDTSMWLLDPNRTVEELDYFSQTGQRPTKFTKLTTRVPPEALSRETFPTVYPVKEAGEQKPRANFPPNPNQGSAWLDSSTGTYYLWTGTKWRVLANTPLKHLTRKNYGMQNDGN